MCDFPELHDGERSCSKPSGHIERSDGQDMWHLCAACRPHSIDDLVERAERAKEIPVAKRKATSSGSDLEAMMERDDAAARAAAAEEALPAPASTGATGATIHDLPLDELYESPLNPRRTFDAAKLAELAQSIREQGVMVPIVVRPREAGGHEIIAGARRVRACAIAERATCPAIHREATDAQVAQMMLVENGQREDVPPLEEAAGYQQALELAGLDEEAIAAKVGKSAATVARRLALLRLVPEAQEAIRDGRITLAAAEMLARVGEADQQRAALGAILPRWEGDVRSTADVRRVILSYHTHPLSTAPFNPGDTTLVEGAPACAVCPHRAGNALRLFGDDVHPDTCTRGGCWSQKVAAHNERLLAGVRERGLAQAPTSVLDTYLDTPRTNSEYRILTQYPHELSGGAKSWAEALRGKKGRPLPEPTAYAQAKNGRVVELWHIRDLLAAARRAKRTVREASTDPSRTDPSRAPPKPTPEFRELEDCVRREVLDAIAVQAESSVRSMDEAAFLRVVWRGLTEPESSDWEAIEEVLRARGVEGSLGEVHEIVDAAKRLVDDTPEPSRLGVLRSLIVRALAISSSRYLPGYVPWDTAFGVLTDEICTQVTQRAAAAAKPPAPEKPARKRKKAAARAAEPEVEEGTP